MTSSPSPSSEVSRLPSPEIKYADLQAIKEHYQVTLHSIDQEYSRDVNAAGTLRGGFRLSEWVGKVEENELEEVDRLINYADEALAEADVKTGKRVAWAEFKEVKIVDRYIKIMDEDSDEELYYADDENNHLNFQHQLAAFPEPPLSAIREERPVDGTSFLPPTSDDTTTNMMEEVDRLVNRMQDIFHTIPVAAQLRILKRFWVSSVQAQTSNDLDKMVEERDKLIDNIQEIFDSISVVMQRQLLQTILEQVELEKRNEDRA